MKSNQSQIGKHVFIDPSAQIIGRVKIGDYSSVWPCCVLRGDIQQITIGRYSNIQDLSLIHVESDRGCKIGDYVTAGHQVTLHACTVKDQALIGIGSIVLDGAVIGEATILGAGSLVTHDQKLKSGSLYFGRPAKFVRKLSNKEIHGLKKWALRYVKYAKDHQAQKFERV
ncbi:MAG TPA: gamma carbonic anhydrase family protein [bacterium]|nr:gamma carbonic anhydrase family protein [bacterium]